MLAWGIVFKQSFSSYFIEFYQWWTPGVLVRWHTEHSHTLTNSKPHRFTDTHNAGSVNVINNKTSAYYIELRTVCLGFVCFCVLLRLHSSCPLENSAKQNHHVNLSWRERLRRQRSEAEREKRGWIIQWKKNKFEECYNYITAWS